MQQPEAGPPRDDALTEQIPPDRWERFLHQFTEFNAEVPVRIEIVGSADAGTGILSDHLPLLDLTLDDAGGVRTIVIECGDPAALHGAGNHPEAFRHMVREPAALWARKTDPMGWDAVQIQSADGSVIVSLDPHPELPSAQEDAGRALFQAGSRAKGTP